MDWSVVGTILAGSTALWVAVWTFIRERSPLRELERMTLVLKETPVDAVGRAHLEAVRDHLSIRLNYRYRVPRHLNLLFFSFISFVLGITAVPLWLADPGSYFGGSDTLGLAMALTSTCVALIAAVLSVRFRAKIRRQWVERANATGNTTSTSRGLL